MSTEVERVFSQAKKMITAERNSLGYETVEACQIQKSLIKTKIIAYSEGYYGLGINNGNLEEDTV